MVVVNRSNRTVVGGCGCTERSNGSSASSGIHVYSDIRRTSDSREGSIDPVYCKGARTCVSTCVSCSECYRSASNATHYSTGSGRLGYRNSRAVI